MLNSRLVIALTTALTPLALLSPALGAGSAMAQDAPGPVLSPMPGGGDGGNNGGIPKLPPGLKKLPPGSPWQEVTSTDPQTMCGRGAPFGFFVQEGDPKKLVVNFAGGGACADASSCGTDQPTFFPDLDLIRLLIGSDQGFGVFTSTHQDNPFNGWTQLVIPNCTGDLNLGDRDMTYTGKDGKSFVIHHRGGPNSEAALEWIRARYEQRAQSPERIVVVGSSAGSYASIVWTPQVQELFPDSAVRQLGDSGAGITDGEGGFADVWNVGASLPSWVPGLSSAPADVSKLTVQQIYKALTQFYPKIEFAQFNYNQDEIQSFFSLPFDPKAVVWEALFYGSVLPLQEQPNYHNYVAAGTTHAILVLPQMYTLVSEGVRFTDWLRDYMEGLPPTNVVAAPSYDDNPPAPQPQPKAPQDPNKPNG